MPLTIAAVYENGVLKTTAPLPLVEGQAVSVTVEPVAPRPTEEEIQAMMAAAKTPEEMMAIIRAYPDDDNFDFDAFAKALDSHRPEGRKLFPPELKGITW